SWVGLWFGLIRHRYLPFVEKSGTLANAGRLATVVREVLKVFKSPQFLVLVVLVVTINASWHFFRAWLTSFLHDSGYSERQAILFNSAYFTAADAGSISAGLLTLWLIRLGLVVHSARVLMFFACALLVTISVFVPLLNPGWLQLSLLLIIGFGSLGLFPTYYSLGQDLTLHHQGALVGMLGCITWLATAFMQSEVGRIIEETGSHTRAMQIAGLAPLAGFVALYFCWNQNQTKANVTS